MPMILLLSARVSAAGVTRIQPDVAAGDPFTAALLVADHELVELRLRPTALEEQMARERALEAERDDPIEQAIIHVIRWFSPDYA
jgi:hypothetical protein